MLMRFKQLTLSLCLLGVSAASWSQAVLVKTEKNIEEYKNGKSNFDYYITLFMIVFTFINGVHFMNNIIISYYISRNKKSKQK